MSLNHVIVGGPSPDLALRGSSLTIAGSTSQLNSYIEGSFIPRLNFGGNSVGMVYSFAIGKYVRLGNTVFFNVTIGLTNKGSSTGIASVTGFPLNFTSAYSQPVSLQNADNMNFDVGDVPFVNFQGNSTGVISVVAFGSVIPQTNINFNNNSGISFSGFYFVFGV